MTETLITIPVTDDPAYWTTANLERLPIGWEADDEDGDHWTHTIRGWEWHPADGVEPAVNEWPSSILERQGLLRVHPPSERAA